MVTIKVVARLAAIDANGLGSDPILAGPKPGRDPEGKPPAQAEGGEYDEPSRRRRRLLRLSSWSGGGRREWVEVYSARDGRHERSMGSVIELWIDRSSWLQTVDVMMVYSRRCMLVTT